VTIDEGYIKFQSDWTRGPAPDPGLTAMLNRWRRPLYDRGLVGHDDNLGVGFGNISVRADDNAFVISGTQTGHVVDTGGEHYTLVAGYDIDANSVRSVGPVEASSESLTHAAIYELDAGIGAIVHVHSRRLWERLRNVLPTTRADVAYGTPAMAREFARLYRETPFATDGVAIMGGHQDGIVSIGATLEDAAQRILEIERDNR
jgi:L-ribulose-5-phosphate 4-epimerase